MHSNLTQQLSSTKGLKSTQFRVCYHWSRAVQFSWIFNFRQIVVAMHCIVRTKRKATWNITHQVIYILTYLLGTSIQFSKILLLVSHWRKTREMAEKVVGASNMRFWPLEGILNLG